MFNKSTIKKLLTATSVVILVSACVQSNKDADHNSNPPQIYQDVNHNGLSDKVDQVIIKSEAVDSVESYLVLYRYAKFDKLLSEKSFSLTNYKNIVGCLNLIITNPLIRSDVTSKIDAATTTNSKSKRAFYLIKSHLPALSDVSTLSYQQCFPLSNS